MDLAYEHIRDSTDGKDQSKYNGDLAQALVIGPRATADNMTQHVDAWNIFTALLLTVSIPGALAPPENIMELDDTDPFKRMYQWCLQFSIGLHLFTMMLGNNFGNMLRNMKQMTFGTF